MNQLENNLSDIFDIVTTEKKEIVVAEPEQLIQQWIMISWLLEKISILY